MGSPERTKSPEEAFWLLGDQTRVDILRAVWEAPEEPVTFTEIRERIGTPDSGKFNYHIGKLRGHFLAAGDDGYRLTQAGREVVRAVVAGTITDRPDTDPEPIDADCVECSGPLQVRYDDRARIECSDCGATVMWNEFPPAGLEGRSPGELARAFDRWTQRRFRLAMDGVCPSCASEMATTIEHSDVAEAEDADIATNHRCTNCDYRARVPLFGHVLTHPAVVSFFHDRDVDIAALPYWRLQSLARSFTERVVGEDPWLAEVEVEADGDRLVLTLDEELAVVEVDTPET